MRFKYFSKCDKCNTWVRSRSTFYSLHNTSKCISEREAGLLVDVVEEDVVIDDTELYELGQPAHGDDDGDDHMLLPTVEEGEVANDAMPSYAETGSFAANLAVEGEDTAQDYEANGRDFWYKLPCDFNFCPVFHTIKSCIFPLTHPSRGISGRSVSFLELVPLGLTKKSQPR